MKKAKAEAEAEAEAEGEWIRCNDNLKKLPFFKSQKLNSEGDR